MACVLCHVMQSRMDPSFLNPLLSMDRESQQISEDLLKANKAGLANNGNGNGGKGNAFISDKKDRGGGGGGNNDDSLNLEDKNVINSYIDDADPKLTLRLTLILGLGNAIDAIEIMCLGFIIADLGDDISIEKKELLSAAVFIGMLAGGIFGGALSDSFGRKFMLLFSLLLNALAGLLSPFAPSADWLIAFRIFGGIGIGSSIPILFSLASELLPNKSRGKMMALIASFWMVGSIYTAIIAWIVLGKDFNNHRIYEGPYNDWRGFAFICALPVVATVALMYFFVPESPRWLWNQDKLNQIPHELNLITGKLISINELISCKRTEATQRLSLYQKCIMKGGDSYSAHSMYSSDMHSSSISNTESLLEKSGPEKNLKSNFLANMKSFSSPDMKRKLLVLCFVWFVLCFGTYGLNTWITILFENCGLKNPYFDSFIFTLSTLPGNFFSYRYIDVIGRRKLLLVGMILAAISSILLSSDINNVYCVVICACLFNIFSINGWNALDILTAESFVTRNRSLAMGLCTAMGRLGAIVAQFVFGSLIINDVPVLLVVTSSLMFSGGLAVLLLPKDTNGGNLED